MKAYQAYATGGFYVTAETAKKAAEKFFLTFPRKRKCNVTEGKIEGDFFVVSYGRASDGGWPMRFPDVTKKEAVMLPDN